MAGTSVLYNVYHALIIGHMPWYTGVLEGLVPLLLAIGVLEIAAAWKSWEQAVAWLVTAGAMAWSAAATGAVVQPGAPGHIGWPFGILADAAALYAMRFILNGPTAEQAVARVSQKIAELTGAVEAEQVARTQAEAAHRAKTERMTADFDRQVSAVRTELEEVQTALGEARREAETSTARAEALAQKLAGTAKRSGGGPARSKTAARTGSGTSRRTAPDDDLELEAKALKLLATDLDMSGAELARQLGVSEGYGRKLRRRLTGDRPSETEADRAGTAPGDRTEDRT
jgi:DNA gyrase/topoisomerase IV subunit A